MLKQLINNSADPKNVLEKIQLNWDIGYPLIELFGSRVSDENLLIQLESALKQLCLLDYRLQKNPKLIKDKHFLKELKKGMNAFLILIPGYDGIALLKFLNGEYYHIEIIKCHHDSDNIYPLKDINLYFK
jgi:hypothetical protein